MAADLGTWPSEQATVLLEVLQAGGLHPDARRVRGEVHVTVPDEEGDKAHATLVANMDRIAQAARPADPGRSRGAGGSRKLRAIEGGRSGGGSRREPRRRSPSSSRGGGAADQGRTTVVAIAIVGFGTAVLMAAGGAPPTLPLVLMTGALVWVLGKRAERGM